MDNIEEKLGAILNNPQMMQQIMSMAQAMNQNSPQQEQKTSSYPAPPPSSGFDLNSLARISNFAQKGVIDNNQQSLLRALKPYLSKEKISKLERAMRAAKIAGVASGFLNGGGMKFLSGR